MTHRLDPLFAPRSIAVIGASVDPTRIGGVPVHALQACGFPGPVWPVNPKYAQVQGLPCFSDVAVLPAAPDLVLLAVPAEGVLQALEAAHGRGARAALVYASGFEEDPSEAAQARGAALAAFAQRTGMPVAGPNCMGGASPATHSYTAFVPTFLANEGIGDTALLTQSGNLCAVLWRQARDAGLGFSHIVNTGNETGVEFAEYLEWLADDPATHRVLAYVEALRDGPRFLAAARRLRAAGKPLLVLKSGRTAKGAEAARSHTAALAGDGRAYEAAFRTVGAAAAPDARTLVQAGALHAALRAPVGPNCAVVTVSGAAGALLADALTGRGFALPTLSAVTQARLRALVPSYGMVGNPVDMTGNVMNSLGEFTTLLGVVAADPSVDQVVLYLPGPLLARGLPALREVAATLPKPLLLLDAGAPGNRAAALDAGFAFMTDITDCAESLAMLRAWGEAPPAPPRFVPEPMLDAPPTLDEAAIANLLGLPVPPSCLVTDAAGARVAAVTLGFPLVAKIVSPDIAHKTEVGGVRLNLRDAAAAEAATEALLREVPARAPGASVTGVLLQRQVTGGVELIMGGTRDPIFGWMVTVGLGGIWTELMGDAVHDLAPIDEARAEAMLRGLRGFALLDGYRGAPLADVAAAAAALATFSRRLLRLPPEVCEAEVNPLLVLPLGQGVFAADALLIAEGC